MGCRQPASPPITALLLYELLVSVLSVLPPVLQNNVVINCCATFMVHRDRVLQRPREMYETLFNLTYCKVAMRLLHTEQLGCACRELAVTLPFLTL